MKLVGNVSFKNQSDFQSIYSSQLYGTFFAVYAKFTLDENDEKLQTIELALINYKGDYNLGLVENKITEEELVVNEESGMLKFKIHVRALSKSYGGNTVTLKLENPIDLSGLDIFFIDRKLYPMHTDKHGNSIGIYNGLFDKEFYYRDGDLLVKRPRIDYEISSFLKPGDRCKTATNMIT